SSTRTRWQRRMNALPILAALALATAFAAVPAASAAAPCVVGDNPSGCLAHVELYVCVTEPCEVGYACVAYGTYCTRL
ncbi:MAG TPA: hypothetical protein VM582_09065, partial [Candidatus Thermoplasmatota archaeon]|nr:hypothetical protein [Candidatus Thermoplasmatota archaeon]